MFQTRWPVRLWLLALWRFSPASRRRTIGCEVSIPTVTFKFSWQDGDLNSVVMGPAEILNVVLPSQTVVLCKINPIFRNTLLLSLILAVGGRLCLIMWVDGRSNVTVHCPLVVTAKNAALNRLDVAILCLVCSLPSGLLGRTIVITQFDHRRAPYAHKHYFISLLFNLLCSIHSGLNDKCV